nr:DNA mismatch repair protein MutS [Desulfobacterales bacterium]
MPISIPAMPVQGLSSSSRPVSLEGFGYEGMMAGICAAGALLYYVKETQKDDAEHLSRVLAYSLSEYMVVDEVTKRNLELFQTIRDGSKQGSLFGIMDRTVTAMGGRLLRRWLQYPLVDKKRTDQRLDAVEEAREDLTLRRSLREVLDGIYDLERLNSSIVLAHSNARDLVALKLSLKRIPEIKRLLGSLTPELFVRIHDGLDDLTDIADLIERAIRDDPPITIRERGIIRPGYSHELDQIAEISKNGKEWISRLEKREREATGINSLKVGFNKVFGYYIEVSKTHLKSVPDHYIRKQTLVGEERYITQDLKTYETKVLEAEERRSFLEYELFQDIRKRVAQQNLRIQNAANLLAKLDTLLSLAELADENDYVKPEVHCDGRIFLEEARHPVIEKLMVGERFIPNTIEMDDTSRQVLIITGPNMAGKSTLLRQVALLVLMAQMGSFVPARSASITLVVRIFTRVGALDNLSQGQSTFMVEMQETANILNTATERSLAY